MIDTVDRIFAALPKLKASILKDTPKAKVVCSTDYDALLGDMDMIVTSTSGAGKKILDITKVKPGCVITDVARPLDLPHGMRIGVIYRDGRTPELSPAYDIVAYSAYLPGRGHALPFALAAGTHARLSPASVRAFCNECEFPETLAASVIRSVVKSALDTWPDMIASSQLLDEQKRKLLHHFESVPLVAGALKRKAA